MTHTVIYRTGGTDNFQWHRVLDTYADQREAVAKKVELERAGYPAIIHLTKRLDAIGMPETFGGR